MFLRPTVEDPIQEIDEDLNLDKVASGQRLIILAIVLYIAGVILQIIIGPLVALVGFVSVILGIIGVIRLARGLRFSVFSTILLVISLFIPLVGLLVLLVLSGKATKALRAGGYHVGLMGAS